MVEFLGDKKKFTASTKAKSAEIILAFLVVLSGLLLAFANGNFTENINKVGFATVSTFQKGANLAAGSVLKVVTSVRDLTQLKKEYDALVEKLADYEYMQRSNVEIRKENERLRSQLGFATEIQYKNIPAQIIGRDPDALYSGITLNKGSRHGVRKGFPVLAIQGGNVGIVGRVVTVGLETCMVMPLYDSKCNISARIQNTRDIGIVSGRGTHSSYLNLQHIRKTVFEDLHEGDVVVTSGENGNYMKDVPIGRIRSVEALDYDSSLAIEIEPAIDFLTLENVLIVDQNTANDKPPAQTIAEEDL